MKKLAIPPENFCVFGSTVRAIVTVCGDVRPQVCGSRSVGGDEGLIHPLSLL